MEMVCGRRWLSEGVGFYRFRRRVSNIPTTRRAVGGGSGYQAAKMSYWSEFKERWVKK
jgi:hypothetical protein